MKTSHKPSLWPAFRTGAAMTFAALLLTACGIGQTGVAPALYDLGADSPGSNAPVSAAAGTPIALSFDAIPALSDPGMIWRVGDGTALNVYTQARWASPPAELVRQRLTERLARLRPVLPDPGPGLPRLQVTLTQFEQTYEADGSRSAGQLALQAVLLDRNGRVLSQRLVRSLAPAPTLNAEGGAQALRQAADDAADALAAWLTQQLP